MEEKISQAQPIAEFAVQISYEDYKQYYWFWMRREGRKRLWIWGMMFVLIVVYGLFFLDSEGYFIIFLLSLLGTYTGLVLTQPRRTYKRYRARFEAQCVYRFFEDHLAAQCNDRGSEQTTVSQYERYINQFETSTAFYLKTPDKDYVILPKRCIAQTETLRALFARTFGARFKGNK